MSGRAKGTDNDAPIEDGKETLIARKTPVGNITQPATGSPSSFTATPRAQPLPRSSYCSSRSAHLFGTGGPVYQDSESWTANEMDADFGKMGVENAGDIPYSVDEIGEEMSPDARVWRVYLSEAIRYDRDMVNGMNHSLDVLLVFAGLFSAVVTTFLVQSSLSLQPDNARSTVVLLAELIALQRATAKGLSIGEIPSSQDINASFQPTLQNRWINGLWYISLAFSLTSAFMSMLVKQWLQTYMFGITGSPQERVRLRHFRYMGLQGWHVPGMVGGLPVLMHTSLLLFFLGLIQLLESLDTTISWTLTCIVALAYIIYLASTLLPIFKPQCPYKTPLSEYVLMFIQRTHRFVSSRSQGFWNRSRRPSNPDILPSSTRGDTPTIPPVRLDGHSSSLRTAELLQIRNLADSLDAHALSWLFTASADETVTAVALQSLAGLRQDFNGFKVLHEYDALQLVERAFQSSLPCHDKSGAESLADIERADRYGRALLNLATSLGRGARIEHPDSISMYRRLSATTEVPDIAVISSCALIRCSEFGLRTILRGVGILRQVVEGELTVSTYTLTVLLDSIASSVVMWGVPSDIVPCISSIPVFAKFLEIFEPPVDNELGRAFAAAFYLCVTPRCNMEQVCAFRTSNSHKPRDTQAWIVQSLMTALHNYQACDEADIVLPLVVKRLTELTLAALTSVDPVVQEASPVDPTYSVVAALLQLFVSGQLHDSGISDHIKSSVLLLFLRASDHVPFDDPEFLPALVTYLHSTDEETALLRSLALIRNCITQCSLNSCRTFMNHRGPHKLLEMCKGVARLSSIAGLTLCAFAENIAIGYRQNEDVEEELDMLFQSQAVAVMCSRAGSQRMSLFEIHKHWLPPLLQLCRIRPKEPVWREAMKTIIEPVKEVIAKEDQAVVEPDRRLFDLGRSIIADLEEMKALLEVIPGEECYDDLDLPHYHTVSARHDPAA